MDNNKENDADDGEEESHFSLDQMSEEEIEEEEEEEPENADSWPSFPERIAEFKTSKKCDAKIAALDERQAIIELRIRETLANAPKTFADIEDQKKSRLDRQLEKTEKRLDELIHFGDRLVTNIRVVNDSLEFERSHTEQNVRDMLLDDLRSESEASSEKFEEIMQRWKTFDGITEPMVLWNKMQTEKENIAAIMKSKDDMIERCQKEIDRINEQFQYDRLRQSADLCCLVERVDNQIELLKEAHKNQINMLANTIEDERQIFLVNATEKWQQHFDAMNENFNFKSEAMKSRENFYMQQTKRIVEQQEELTKMTRIRLDKDCDQLEIDLRVMRDAVLMNSEKLDYNYQVLQKRNEENVIVNNQQKRRVAKLHEQYQELRNKITAAKKSSNLEIENMSQEIRKIHATITEMEKKSHSLRLKNKSKFDRIWEMNYSEMMEKVNRINLIDKKLHEEQLMLPWSEPPVDTKDINLEFKRQERFKRLKKKSKQNDVKELSPDTLRLLRNILRKLTDRGGFLIEERLLQIIEPFKERDRCLVRLDNIFEALRVRCLRDIASLTEVFEKYTYCPNCQDIKNRETCAEVFMRESRVARGTKKQSMSPPYDVSGAKRHQSLSYQRLIAKSKDKKNCTNHYLVMEPTLVLHAMNVFTAKKNFNQVAAYQSSTQSMLNYIVMDTETIRTFWRKFRRCMPQSKINLWNKLEHGLNHYLEVLKRREQLHKECVFLRRQNWELKHLLQRYTV